MSWNSPGFTKFLCDESLCDDKRILALNTQFAEAMSDGRKPVNSTLVATFTILQEDRIRLNVLQVNVRVSEPLRRYVSKDSVPTKIGFAILEEIRQTSDVCVQENHGRYFVFMGQSKNA